MPKKIRNKRHFLLVGCILKINIFTFQLIWLDHITYACNPKSALTVIYTHGAEVVTYLPLKETEMGTKVHTLCVEDLL